MRKPISRWLLRTGYRTVQLSPKPVPQRIMALSDIITLDNLREKLPLWSPDDESQLYAIVDMGSNGIRFSITSLAPPNTRLLTPVFSTRAAISLFDALTPSASGLIFPASTIASVSATLSHFRRLAALHDVPSKHILVLATEAMRRAANAADMLNAIAKATDGLGVHVLDPPVETLLGAVMGSRSGLVDVKGGALFLDLGGGSVQMTWVDTSMDSYEIHAASAGESLPYGAAKLMRVLENEQQDVQAAEVGKLQVGIQRVYANLCSKFPALKAIRSDYERGSGALVDVYMCGGGFRGYGSLLMHTDPITPYPIPSVNHYTVGGERFRDTARMRQVNEIFDGKIFGMSKRRRQQFPAIATVVEAFVGAVPNIGRVTFCGGSNRTGALLMKLPYQIRESNPLEVLANVTPEEKPAFDALLRKILTALPHGVDISNIPSVLSRGLDQLFVRQIWARHGHDADTNSSFALHDAITRDSDCPGLTHLARSVLGLTLSARWGAGLGFADAQLHNGLRGILESQHPEAFFWSQFLGAVSSVLAAIFPILPRDVVHLEQAINFEAHVVKKRARKDKIVLTIGIAPQDAEGVNLESLVDTFQVATKKNGLKKTPISVAANVVIISKSTHKS